AKSRGGVGAIGTVVRLEWCRRHRNSAWICVLYDYARRASELTHAFDRGIRVGYVVERKVLSLQHPCRRHARSAQSRIAVERRLLMRVLAIAQILRFVEYERERPWESIRGDMVGRAKVTGDHGVITSGVRECLCRQA